MLSPASPMALLRHGLLALSALALTGAAASAQDAASRYGDACDDGDLAACTLLGLMYERGAGVAADPNRAAGLYEAACEGGQLRACINLGLLLEGGRGVGRNPVRAASLYRQVCAGGEAMGCDLLAQLERAAATGGLGQFRKTGRVEDAESGNALRDAVVEVPSLGIRVVSDAAGVVDLGRLPEGKYGVVAERFGYEGVTGEVEVPGNADFVVQLFSASVGDPFAPGRIVGRVLAEDGSEGLANVDVSGGDPEVRALSGTEGRFALERVPGGLVEVRFAHLGYEPRSTQVVLQPGATVEMTVNLATRAIELAPIEVSVRSRYLERSGFYRRAQQGWGTHFSPEDIARIDPIYTSDLIRGRVPGVRVVYARGETYAVSRRAESFTMGTCRLAVYVDGVPTFDDQLDRLSPQWIEAMEVYHGSGTPIEYGGCGVVLVWTNR
jgi:hypothetical protein